MAIDWVAHYNTIYSVLGQPATLTLDDTGSTEHELTVIDHTEGVEVADDVSVFSIRPVADIRISEMEAKGIDREELDGSTLVFDSKTWTVRTHALKHGEVRLILSG